MDRHPVLKFAALQIEATDENPGRIDQIFDSLQPAPRQKENLEFARPADFVLRAGRCGDVDIDLAYAVVHMDAAVR